MLDVARHFFTVDEVKRFIDSIAYYKLNRLHLHLTDDQGWRLMIESWPNLALHGGKTEVGGGQGGYYTQAEYRELVEYAAARNVMVVPEIEMPGHSQAALASYPELTCEGVAPPLYTGIEVGFSTLCLDNQVVNAFVADVIREVAALTPGPYIHIGGDETFVLPTHRYVQFVRAVEGIVMAAGKRMIGWEEIGAAQMSGGAIVQHWRSPEALSRAVAKGHPVILSPTAYAYLDSKYSPSTIGRASPDGFLNVRKAYSWDPDSMVPMEGLILGVEGPLWTETVGNMAEAEFLAFPRLIGYSEIGWSPKKGRSWEQYRMRLATHADRLGRMRINFYRTPEVPWE